MVKQKIALVIDDEPDVVDVVKECLKSELHYLVLSATDSQVAVDYAQNYLFDLLVIDLHMPKLDGLQVLEMVRKKQPTVKVMVITGLYEQYADRLQHANIDKVVEKPFEIPQFEEEIIALAGAAEQPAPSEKDRVVPKAKILLVDDEREQSEALKEFILEDQPNAYEVEVAERAEDGIRLVSEFEPDLLLFDIKMPHLKGDEMMEQIKKGAGYQPKQFIVVSAVGLPETVKRLKQQGCLYVTKPFRIEEVLKLLRKTCADLKLTSAA